MTVIASGLGAQLMYGEESTWGTRATPTRALEFESETLALTIDRVEGKGLRSGQRYLRSDRWQPGKRGVAGDVVHEVSASGFGLILKHCLGAAAISQPAAVTDPTVYEVLATPGSLAGVGLTCQIGRPDNAGTSHPFDYIGLKIAQWDLSTSVDGLAMLKLTFDGADEQTNQTLAVASYATDADDELLTWAGAVLTLGGSAVEVRDVTITGTRARKNDRYFLGSSTKSEQIENALSDVTIKATPEFSSLTEYNHYLNADEIALTVNFEGSIISTTYHRALEFTAAAVRFDSPSGPNVAGPDVLTEPLTMKATDDGTDPVVQMLYRTTDNAI